MNSNNIKRRRPYCQDDTPAEPVLRDQSSTSFLAGDNNSPSPPAQYQYILDQAASTHVSLNLPLSTILDLGHQDNQRYILEQAAYSLNVPLPLLLQSSHRRHPPPFKRQRLNPDVPMSTPFSSSPFPQDVQEKLPLPSHQNQTYYDGYRPSSPSAEDPLPSGWTGSRLASCFASFSVCSPCSPHEAQPTYQPLPDVAQSSGTVAWPTVFEARAIPTRVSEQEPFAPGPIARSPATTSADQGSFFACDGPLISHGIANYPPLQPVQVTGSQPNTSKESMTYPETSFGVAALRTAPFSNSVPQLNIRYPQSLERDDVGPSGVRTEGNVQSTNPQTAYIAVSQPLGAMGSYEVPRPTVKGELDSSRVQQRPSFDVVFPHQRMPSARRGPFKDHDQRERTAYTRKIGSCIRCRMQRIRCNLDPEDELGPCLTCKKVANNNKIWRLSCLRWKITDVRLFKPGQVKGYEWTDRWKDSVIDDIGSWASSDIRTIRVTEGFTNQSVELLVRRFQPQEGDRLERSWISNGEKKSVSVPPYAIVDMEAAKRSFDNYIKKGLVECCKRLLGPREKLLWQTYALAMKVIRDGSTSEKERALLRSTLDLWMSVRLTTKSFEIVGDDTLGMPRDIIKDEANPLHGKVPIPPVMGAQIDSVLIHQVQPALRRKTLEDLQKMTQDKKQRTWLTTYLVTFILLHNLALITRHDADYARKHGMKGRFAREEKVKEYNIGANTLLAYFHYCNRGIYPFSEECKDQELQNMADLDESGIRFVHYTRRYAADHKREWEKLWKTNDYEDEYYYVSQLYEQNWQPRLMA